MKRQRVENLLGALALAVTDAVSNSIGKLEGAYGSDTFALVLLQHAERLRSDVLSRQLGLAQSSTVRLVDRLEREGLVAREAGVDRRTVMISLTGRGERAAEAILAARRDVLKDLVGTLSDTEKASLLAISTKLLTSLTVDLESGEHNCRLCDETACNLAECPVELRYQTFDGALQPPAGKGRAAARESS
ncbi:MAG: MarR family transcriptional regulator [Steroidobacteraceae bacterium]